ncbi:integrase [Geomonas sp. Red276]
MPKRILPLSDSQVEDAKPGDRDYKLSDGYGLHLLVTTKGGKLWRFQYRFAGKQKLLCLGAYPAVSLVEARQKLEEARKQLAGGVDPSELKKILKVRRPEEEVKSLEDVSRRWYEQAKCMLAPSYAKEMLARLEIDVFHYVGKKHINNLTQSELLIILQQIENRSKGAAQKVKTVLNHIFKFAIEAGITKLNPVSDLHITRRSAKVKQTAATIELTFVLQIIRSIDEYEPSNIIKYAMQLSILLIVEYEKLLHALWSELNLEERLWYMSIHPQNKNKITHMVPLSRQAIMIIKELRSLTGNSAYVFPGHRSSPRCMSNNAVVAAFRRMGFDECQVMGNFTLMAKTTLEGTGFAPDVIERQLSFTVNDPDLQGSDGEGKYLDTRRQMMQRWADYLDELKGGANGVPKVVAGGTGGAGGSKVTSEVL